METVKIRLFDYDKEHFKEMEMRTIEEAIAFKESSTVTWLNIDGIHDVDLLQKMGEHFNLHSLVLEDVVSTGQRPKLENYEQYFFIVSKMLHYDEESGTIHGEQISLVLSDNFLISFQEQAGDLFDIIRQSIRSKDSRVRKNGADYLAYRILDTIVDHFFVILEKIGERIEDLELELLENPSQDTLHEIHHLKRELIYLRKSIWPMREIISGITREDSRLIKKTTEVFLRDVYDHTIQVIDTIENFRDMVSGMLDIYLSSVSNKMNEVMKVLTIMASIFIPLTFMAGIYGMNFNTEISAWNMPELNWTFGYPLIIMVMIVIVVIMIIFFRKKEWL